MTNPKKNPPEKLEQKTTEFHHEHLAQPFSLSFLEPEDQFSAVYENELLTAEEKAAYFQYLAENSGQPNSKKIARDCRKRADKLRAKALAFDKDWQELTLPLTQHAIRLENLAWHLDHPDDPEVLAAQNCGLEKDNTARPLPDGENAVNIKGLPNLEPINDQKEITDSASQNENLKKARFWKNIHKWNLKETMAYYFCGPIKPIGWGEAIFVRAQKDPLAVQILANEADDSIGRLLELAKMGNQEAAKIAIAHVEKLVRTLNVYAKTDPEAFRKAAGELTNWPVMISRHPKLNYWANNVVGNIGVGHAYPFIITESSEWDPRRDSCRIAICLYEHVKTVRLYPESYKYIYCDTGDKNAGGDESLPINEAAAKLPEINARRTVRKWWNIGKRVIEFSYPDPKKEPRLRALTNIKNSGKIKSKIMESLANSFESLFHDEYR